MRAVRLTRDGLNVDELEIPRPSEGEVLVRVCAAAITRGESTWPFDRLPATPLYELSGVVVAVAPDVEAGAVDEEVFALTHVESAALTLAGLSARQGLFDHGALRNRERVRVVGSDGGVGHLAGQLAGDALARPDKRADLLFDTVGGEALAAAVGCLSRAKGENSIQGGAG
jgi:NADPH:quinone reductase-like Zn-dependent oxidoreductase